MYTSYESCNSHPDNFCYVIALVHVTKAVRIAHEPQLNKFNQVSRADELQLQRELALSKQNGGLPISCT